MPSIVTPEAILSYPALFEPKTGPSGGDARYGCSLVFPPGTDISALVKAANDAAVEEWGPKATELIRAGRLRMPFRKDAEDKGYAPGSIFINVRSKQAPGVVNRYPGTDGKPAPITNPEEVYPGCHVRASVKAFAYDTNGNKGVSFGLNNIQKLGDGPRIDGRKRAEDEFDVIEDEAADLL